MEKCVQEIAEAGIERRIGMAGEELRQLRRRMQIIFQDPGGSLNPRMRVGRIVVEHTRESFPPDTPLEKLHKVVCTR
jgi:ABC-type microcin C transport system duplicated ATPase subunit YejF